MASTDTLLILDAQNGVPPAANYAGRLPITGTSTPAETIPAIDFDDTSIEYMDFVNLVLPAHYAGGGLTVTIVWAAASATTGSVIWGAAIRRVADDAEDQDTTAHTYDYNNSAAAAAPSAAGEVSYDNITFTSGADMDSLAAGEMFHLRIRRDPTNGSDDLVGDAKIQAIHIKET